MAGDINHIIDAAHDPVVTVLVTARSVACEVHSWNLAPILLLVAFGIAVDRPQHRRPWTFDHQKTALIRADRVSLAIDDIRNDSGQWPRRGSRFRRNCAGNG